MRLVLRRDRARSLPNPVFVSRLDLEVSSPESGDLLDPWDLSLLKPDGAADIIMGSLIEPMWGFVRFQDGPQSFLDNQQVPVLDVTPSHATCAATFYRGRTSCRMINTAPSTATDDVVSIAGMKSSWHASKLCTSRRGTWRQPQTAHDGERIENRGRGQAG